MSPCTAGPGISLALFCLISAMLSLSLYSTVSFSGEDKRHGLYKMILSNCSKTSQSKKQTTFWISWIYSALLMTANSASKGSLELICSDFSDWDHFCSLFSMKFKCHFSMNEPKLWFYIYLFSLSNFSKMYFCAKVWIIYCKWLLRWKLCWKGLCDFLLDILRLMLLEPFPVKMPSLVQLK